MFKSRLSQWKRSYDTKILENGEAVSNLESLLRAALFVCPGRFTDSELSTEVAYTGLSLVTLYHDYINAKDHLKKGRATTRSGDAVPPPYCLNLAKWLSIVQSVEVLIEIFSQNRFGEKGKWVSITLVEIIKALLRFKMMIRTNGNILTYESLPSRDTHSNLTGSSVFHNIEKKYVQTVPPPSPGSDVDSSGDSFPSSSYQKKRKVLSDYLKEERESKASQNTLMSLLPPPSPPDMLRRLVGESLYILRPLIYLFSLYMYGQKSWKPWCISLLSDVTSYLSLSRSSHPLSLLEQDVLKRRTHLWAYYLLRSPFFDVFLGEDSFARKFKKIQSIPFFKVLFATLFDYILVYRTRYFYTSAS